MANRNRTEDEGDDRDVDMFAEMRLLLEQRILRAFPPGPERQRAMEALNHFETHLLSETLAAIGNIPIVGQTLVKLVGWISIRAYQQGYENGVASVRKGLT